MTKENAMYFMTGMMENLKLKYNYALKCYAMSKMTVVNEEKMD